MSRGQWLSHLELFNEREKIFDWDKFYARPGFDDR